MTTTPKRKRGQHAKRHPRVNAGKRNLPEAFNDDDCRRWEAFTAFANADKGHVAATADQAVATYKYFMAGYRAGKDAK